MKYDRGKVSHVPAGKLPVWPTKIKLQQNVTTATVTSTVSPPIPKTEMKFESKVVVTVLTLVVYFLWI